MKRRSIAILAFFAATATTAAAETQLWTEAGVKHDLSKRWTLAFDGHLRFDADVSRVGSIMPEPSVAYRVKKWFRTGAGYRYQYERDKDGIMVSRHRGYLWGKLRKDVGDVRAEYRLQLQEEYRPDANPDYRHTIRNRGDVSWQGFGDIVPGLAVEAHHILNEDGSTIHLGKVWLTGGIEYERDAVSLDLFYRAIVGQDDPTEPTGHIVGVGVHYEI
jgi:hypothetical protein